MKVYFLGIGGIGMSAIARYCKAKGYEVSGYDRTPSPLTEQLEQERININYDDIAENVPADADLVIYTPAIPENSVQLNFVRSHNIPLEKRSVALGHITADKKVLSVAGTHGKTTTCGMIAHIMNTSPIGCSAFLGGILKNTGSNFIFNENSPYVVAEADEYDRSFLQLHPHISVITSIDEDHMDIYKTYDNLHGAFEQFALQTDKDGILLVKNHLKRLKEKVKHLTPWHTYSLSDTESDNYIWNIRISKGSYYFDYKNEECVWYDMQMKYPGIHNAENAVAALTVCNHALQESGYGLKEREQILRQGLLTVEGMKRRLDFVLRREGRILVDDYAHHPQEIASTIESLRHMYPDKHFTGIFQPHLYTRTRDLADGFARNLEQLDTVILLPVYPAREEPIAGVDSHMILRRIDKMDKYLVTKQQLFPLLEALEPEFVITFGAGDIDRLVGDIAKTLNCIDDE